MRKKGIIILSTIIFFVSSCITLDYKKSGNDIVQSMQSSEFQSMYEPVLYRTNIQIFKNNFSGITVIKPTENKNHRIVFLNEVGMKFFDFEIGKDTFIVHQIFTPLNKKSFLKLLENDFRLMLFYDADFSKYKLYQDRKQEKEVWKDTKKRDFYYPDYNSSFFYKIVRKSAFRTIVTVDYVFKNVSLPQEIIIKHKNIKFEMKFNIIL